MSTPVPKTVPVPILKCMYKDCGNEWVPRTDRMPKVCPKCKRYGWEEGTTKKRKSTGGKKHVTKMVESAHLGPQTKKFLKQRKET